MEPPGDPLNYYRKDPSAGRQAKQMVRPFVPAFAAFLAAFFASGMAGMKGRMLPGERTSIPLVALISLTAIIVTVVCIKRSKVPSVGSELVSWVLCLAAIPLLVSTAVGYIRGW